MAIKIFLFYKRVSDMYFARLEYRAIIPGWKCKTRIIKYYKILYYYIDLPLLFLHKNIAIFST